MSIAILSWYSYCAFVLGDYFFVNDRSTDEFFYIASIAAIGLGFTGLARMLKYWRLQHDFLDADVRISSQQIRPGDAIQLYVRQEFRAVLEVEEMSIGLVCICDDRTYTGKSTRYTSNEEWSSWRILPVNRVYASGAHLDAKGHVTVPPEASPTSTPNQKSYPLYRWYIALRIAANKQPRLDVHFPIKVDARG